MNSIIMAVISSLSSNGTQKDTLAQGKLVSPQHSLSNHQGILFSLFSKNLLFYYLKNIWSMYLIYNFILVSGTQQSESVYIYIYIYKYVCVCVRVCFIYIYKYIYIFSHIGHYRVLSRIPCAIQQVLLVIYFLYSGVYMSIPERQTSYTTYIWN